MRQVDQPPEYPSFLNEKRKDRKEGDRVPHANPRTRIKG